MTTTFLDDEYNDFHESFETMLVEPCLEIQTKQTKLSISGKTDPGILFPVFSSGRLLGRGFYRVTNQTEKNSGDFHIPVLLDEVLLWILVKTKGIYLDCTVGGGAHAEAIIRRLSPNGLYLGMDQDQEAIHFASNRLNQYLPQLRLKQANFSELGAFLEEQEIEEVDGILMDLGISSHQVDTPNRGFSFMQQGPLDMRLGSDTKINASQIVNGFGEKELVRIFFEYGEERQSRAIARRIVRERENKSIQSTTELAEIIKQVIHPVHVNKTLARIFQAIRIEVNKELLHLVKALESALVHMKKGGRIIVISYHSLEDRVVKQFFKLNQKRCVCPVDLPVCVCNEPGQLKILTKKPIRPKEEEVYRNPRSRSAKLRVAEKI